MLALYLAILLLFLTAPCQEHFEQKVMLKLHASFQTAFDVRRRNRLNSITCIIIISTTVHSKINHNHIDRCSIKESK